MYSMKARMSIFAPLCAFILPYASFPAVLTVEVPEPSQFADTENSITFPFASYRQNVRNLAFTLEMESTPSNCVEVIFGHDADTNGVIGVDEMGLHFAWDAGEWVMGGADLCLNSFCNPTTTNDVKTLSWHLKLTKVLEPRHLTVLENGEPLFTEFIDDPPPYSYNPLWDAVRVTSRGVDSSGGSIRLESTADGLVIRLR